MAYSWDVKFFSRAYCGFSFLGMGAFRTLYRISGRFWAAWALSIPIYAAFLFNIALRPVFFSVILLTITLSMLIDARSGSARELDGLPLVFLLGANLHIQFIDGPAVLRRFVGVNLLQHVRMRGRMYPDFLERPTEWTD